MVNYTLTVSKVTIAVIFLLAVGTGATTFIVNGYAQTGLGEPFFQERGRIISQQEISPNEMFITFSANGTLKGNIEVTNTGDFVSLSRGNNLTYGEGQGTLTTTDGIENADYSFIGVGNVTQEGKPIFHGTSAYTTNSTGKLGFLNNVLGLFTVEIDESGNFISNEWQLK